MSARVPWVVTYLVLEERVTEISAETWDDAEQQAKALPDCARVISIEHKDW